MKPYKYIKRIGKRSTDGLYVLLLRKDYGDLIGKWEVEHENDDTIVLRRVKKT